MSELQYKYDEKLKEYRCFDVKMDWLVFSGFGKSKAEARIDFFLKQPKTISNTISLKTIA